MYWTSSQVAHLQHRIREGAQPADVARELGIPGRAVQNKKAKLILRYGADWLTTDLSHTALQLELTQDDQTEAIEPSGSTVRDTTNSAGERILQARGRILTLDALLDAAEVDRTRWEVSAWKVNKWEVGAAGPDGAIVTEELWQVRASLAPLKGGAALVELRDQVLADIRAEAALWPQHVPAELTPLSHEGEGYLLEISPADLHVGNLAWHEETGENYDTAIAQSRFRTALDDILRRAAPYRVEQIVVVIGNDLSHVDSSNNETTAGTRQVADDRWQRNMRIARKLMSWGLRRCHAVFPRAKVIGKIIPGNHDQQTAIAVGEVLEMEFCDHPAISVDNGAKLRKYHLFGVNLLGWTHGNNEKPADLPLIMAREVPELWSQASQYEWHIGHLHKSKETRYTAGDEHNGVRVRILPSLCGTDAWHYAKGYVKGRKAMEAYLWGRETGYAGHFSSNVLDRRN